MMSNDHLRVELLRTVLSGDREPRELLLTAVLHLCCLCERCKTQLEAVRQELDPNQTLEWVLSQLLRRDAGHERELGQAVSRLGEVLDLPSALRMEKVQEDPQRYQGSALGVLLLQEYRNRLIADPHEALDLARLARSVLRHDPSPILVIESYIQAVAYTTNALRILGELDGAAERFDYARFLLRSHRLDDVSLIAEIDALEGSLLRAQRRLDESAELLGRALATYRRKARDVEAGNTLLALGIVYREERELELAITVTQEALEILDAAGEDRSCLMARHNLAWLLQEVGDFQMAQMVVREALELYAHYPEPWVQLRFRWLEGQIDRRLGDEAAAEEAFLEVRRGFRQEGMGYDAALASLDLAKLYLRQQRPGELRYLAEELIPTFQELNVQREAQIASTLLEQAIALEGRPIVH